MTFIKNKLALLIAPFKDKIKMQQRINTLENDNEALRDLFENEFQKAMDSLMNVQELEKLKKENQHLRLKVKVLRSNKK
jgi:hypothetical protein